MGGDRVAADPRGPGSFAGGDGDEHVVVVVDAQHWIPIAAGLDVVAGGDAEGRCGVLDAKFRAGQDGLQLAAVVAEFLDGAADGDVIAAAGGVEGGAGAEGL